MNEKKNTLAYKNVMQASLLRYLMHLGGFALSRRYANPGWRYFLIDSQGNIYLISKEEYGILYESYYEKQPQKDY